MEDHHFSIRPLRVRRLTYPEHVRKSWGFFVPSFQ